MSTALAEPPAFDAAFVSRADLRRRWRMSKTRLRQLEDDPRFPRKVSFGPRCTRYRLAEVERFEALMQETTR